MNEWAHKRNFWMFSERKTFDIKFTLNSWRLSRSPAIDGGFSFFTHGIVNYRGEGWEKFLRNKFFGCFFFLLFALKFSARVDLRDKSFGSFSIAAKLHMSIAKVALKNHFCKFRIKQFYAWQNLFTLIWDFTSKSWNLVNDQKSNNFDDYKANLFYQIKIQTRSAIHA